VRSCSSEGTIEAEIEHRFRDSRWSEDDDREGRRIESKSEGLALGSGRFTLLFTPLSPCAGRVTEGGTNP